MPRVITLDELRARLEGDDPVTLVDALPPMYYEAEHLPGAINVPHDEVDALAPALLPDRDAAIVVYCASGPCQNSGIAARRLVALGWIWTTPGFTDEVIHLFAAFDLTRIAMRPEDDEVIEVMRVPLEEALDLIWRGELRDAKSALALIHAARHVGRLR